MKGVGKIRDRFEGLIRFRASIKRDLQPMAHIQAKCPHCFTEKAPLSTVNEHAWTVNERQGRIFLLLRCGVCLNGVMALLPQIPNIHLWISGQLSHPLPVIAIIPEATSHVAPPSTPSNIERFYLQGMDNLTRSNFDAAGTMFRKALDVAIKDLHPHGKGTLYARINSIPDAAGVTIAMKGWAHEIRDLGNDAAHEEEPFEEAEVRQLQSFTEMFLSFAYTMPAMIKARKDASSKD